MPYLLMHILAHLSPLWHVQAGPHGWWAWTQSSHQALGFGIIRDHYQWSWEVR